MTDNVVEVLTNGKAFFDAFNILGFGIMLVWVVASLFISRSITEKKDEFLLTFLIFMMCGGILIFVTDASRYILLIIAVLIVIYGFFRMLWKNKSEGRY